MSKKETQNTEQTPEKIVTRYDRKMQRRKEQKERARREARISRIVGIALVALLVCIVASFPIRNWIALNGTYVEVNGEKITKVQFDYHYNISANNFINQYYSTYYYYFGIDLRGDLSTMMYSADLTWQDYFEQLAVENIAQLQGLAKAGREAGFTYDTTDDYNDLMEDLKAGAAEAGTTVKNYITQVYGSYATQARLKPYIENAMYATAYYNEVAEGFKPSQEEIEAYYNEHTDSYDSVDYYVQVVNAVLPTEPTELADPVEEDTEDTEGAEGTEDETEAAYEPSEAEIAAAMEEAKKEAEAMMVTVKKKGEKNTGVTYSALTALLRDWLFDAERKPGDTTVIEDSAYNRYYVLEFEQRYLDRTRTMDLRAIITTEDNGEAILEEWKNGAATEESFAELCDKYNTADSNSAEGGLLEAVMISELSDELYDWLTDSERKKGDTAVISPEDETNTYVLYYVAPNEEEWVLNIQTTLNTEALSEYMQAFIDSMEVKDTKGNLKYLKVQEQQEADASTESDEEGTESGNEDETGSDGAEDGGEAE